MNLSCSHQTPIGPPPTCPAQQLHCSSVSALAPAVFQSCLAMAPAPSLTRDLPCHYGLACWSWECVWLWLLLSDLAWPWLDDLHINVTTKCLGLQKASLLKDTQLWLVLNGLRCFHNLSDFSVPSVRKINLQIRSSKTLLFWSSCAYGFALIPHSCNPENLG